MLDLQLYESLDCFLDMTAYGTVVDLTYQLVGVQGHDLVFKDRWGAKLDRQQQLYCIPICHPSNGRDGKSAVALRPRDLS
ncbi:hypothetical protein [Sphingomonas sp. PAMC 26621]|uniref:hypothetical protein n=1 Tax=Sphingomonas sp. PAMC 26621 TaxID=1112213 RepID=UPI001479324D|nr:hypothetical protein [Sphingomonas sp. PAMC 26621]